MGFFYNENSVKKGTNLVVWLKHHWEANDIISDKGEVMDLTSAERWPLEVGVTDLILLSVFSSPLTGDEQHDEDGAFVPSGPLPQSPPDY